jgi:uncharacterized integral membrane protein
MSKLKLVWLIILAAVLVDFALENSQPSPMLKFFKFPLTEVPTFLLVYLSLAVGLVLGWFAHAVRLRRKKREAREAQEAASAQQQQESQ